MIDRLLLFWGKTAKDEPQRYHPLLFHMLDVANVACLLWDDCLPPALRRRIAESLGVDEADARAVLILLAGLHDLGKASPPFQGKDDAAKLRLSALSWPVATGSDLHGKVSATALRQLLLDGTLARYTANDAWTLASIIGGHHGLFPDGLSKGEPNRGDLHWENARAELAKQLSDAVDLRLPELIGPFTDPGQVPLLAGFISVADWLGSWEDFFPPANGTDVVAYSDISMRNAGNALKCAGWRMPPRPTTQRSFRALFGFQPNEMQKAAALIADAAKLPYLLIVEEAMGGGKTEAALYVADRARCRTGTGFYVAMPTQATSNAMHRRVQNNYLGDAHANLVHGNASLHYTPTPEPGLSDPDAVAGGAWFTARKRPLLAPFGVGTVDQSLLAVLQSKHWFVRLFGLAGKTVIFDEVHAYDVYMTDLLKGLLHWLSALDCTVVVPSATLPSDKRRALLDAYAGRNVEQPETPYPRLSVVTRGDANAVALPRVKRQAVALQHHTAGPERLFALVTETLPRGGCGAIICNTVARAQETYQTMSSSLPAWEVLLFHARMPAKCRRAIEEQVLAKFGKTGSRPERSILVATQVVEQSLDLDFDWMASDFSPVDLLLQRAGRLWRHMDVRPMSMRPVDCPLLTLLCDGADNDPHFGDSAYVYDEYALLRSWLALSSVRKIAIPAGIEFFVERAYGTERSIPPDLLDRLNKGRDAYDRQRKKDEHAAQAVLIPEPCRPDSLLRRFNADLADSDDPTVHDSVRAATRLGRPSLTIVCLDERSGQLFPFGSDLPIDLGVSPDHPTVLALMDAAVSISHPAIYCALKNATAENSPTSWRRNSHLRHTRLIRFNGGETTVAGRLLRLSAILGLEIPSGPKGETE